MQRGRGPDWRAQAFFSSITILRRIAATSRPAFAISIEVADPLFELFMNAAWFSILLAASAKNSATASAGVPFNLKGILFSMLIFSFDGHPRPGALP
jgi:hypothetical protein